MHMVTCGVLWVSGASEYSIAWRGGKGCCNSARGKATKGVFIGGGTKKTFYFVVLDEEVDKKEN